MGRTFGNPIPSATTSTSPLGILSHRLAMEFMKLTLVARKELFAYMINSALTRSVLISLGISGEYNARPKDDPLLSTVTGTKRETSYTSPTCLRLTFSR